MPLTPDQEVVVRNRWVHSAPTVRFSQHFNNALVQHTADGAASVQLIKGVGATYWQIESEPEEDTPVNGIYWEGGILYQNGNRMTLAGDDHDPADFVTPSVSSFPPDDLTLSTARRTFIIPEQTVDMPDSGTAANDSRQGPESSNFSNNFVGVEAESSSVTQPASSGPREGSPTHSSSHNPVGVEDGASTAEDQPALNGDRGVSQVEDPRDDPDSVEEEVSSGESSVGTTFGLDGASDQRPCLPSTAGPGFHTSQAQVPLPAESQRSSKYKKDGTLKKKPGPKPGTRNKPRQTADDKQAREGKGTQRKDPDETESLASDEDSRIDWSDTVFHERASSNRELPGRKRGNPPQGNLFGTQHPRVEHNSVDHLRIQAPVRPDTRQYPQTATKCLPKAPGGPVGAMKVLSALPTATPQNKTQRSLPAPKH